MSMTNEKARKVLGVQGWMLGHKHAKRGGIGNFQAYSKEQNQGGTPLYRCEAPTLEALCLKVLGKHWEEVGSPCVPPRFFQDS